MNQFECSCGWTGTNDTVAWVPEEEMYGETSGEGYVTACPNCYENGKYRRVSED